MWEKASRGARQPRLLGGVAQGSHPPELRRRHGARQSWAAHLSLFSRWVLVLLISGSGRIGLSAQFHFGPFYLGFISEDDSCKRCRQLNVSRARTMGQVQKVTRVESPGCLARDNQLSGGTSPQGDISLVLFGPLTFLS
uniref:Uncharacterized protein n=1 Tax=Pipistrellus kuhlii TaxID=59472 RepID=A0A7J8B1B8_PIPKU|nr:hypothetical protein mPipKuh1_007669 [Pipistrellus kuhlii]